MKSIQKDACYRMGNLSQEAIKSASMYRGRSSAIARPDGTPPPPPSWEIAIYGSICHLSLEISYIWKTRRPLNVAGLATRRAMPDAQDPNQACERVLIGLRLVSRLFEAGNRGCIMVTSGKYGLNGS